MAGQIERVFVAGSSDASIGPGSRAPAAALPSPAAGAAGSDAAGSVMSSTGTQISRSSSFARPASAIAQRRRGPARNRATSSSGRCVAESPIRCGSAPPAAATRCDRRSRVRARWAPRFECATAWISSTITASTPARISRAPEVSMRYRDSGVVIRMSGGDRRIAWRSRCGVSPVRSPTEILPSPIPARGARRLRSMS